MLLWKTFLSSSLLHLKCSNDCITRKVVTLPFLMVEGGGGTSHADQVFVQSAVAVKDSNLSSIRETA